MEYALCNPPAEVAVQDVVDLLHGGVRVLLQERVQLHHHARAGREIGNNIKKAFQGDGISLTNN